MDDERTKQIVDFAEQLARGEEAIARANRIRQGPTVERVSSVVPGEERADSGGSQTAAGEINPPPSAQTALSKRVSRRLPKPPAVVGGSAGSEWSLPPKIQTTPSGALRLAFPFPEASNARVRAEMIRADADFEREENSRTLSYVQRRALAIRWICRIFAVFAREAFDLIGEGAPHWTSSEIEIAVEEVLGLLAVEAERSKFLEGPRADFTEGQGRLRENVRCEIGRSPEWLEYRDTLVHILDPGADSNRDGVLRAGTSDPMLEIEGDLPKRPIRTLFGANLDRLRRECGWSLDVLAEATGLEKKLVLGHVNKGKSAYPDTVNKYVRAFSEKLGRPVTAADLQGSPDVATVPA